MRVYQIRDQIKDLGEVMLDREMTTIVLNALPDEWGKFVSISYGNKETTSFNDL